MDYETDRILEVKQKQGQRKKTIRLNGYQNMMLYRNEAATVADYEDPYSIPAGFNARNIEQILAVKPIEVDNLVRIKNPRYRS